MRFGWPAVNAWIVLVVVCAATTTAVVGKEKDSDDEAKGSAKSAASAIPAEAKAAFDAAELKVVGANLTLPGEGELNKMFTDIAKQKKALVNAERELRNVEAEVEELKVELNARKVRHVELSAELAQVRSGDTISNNRIVGELNALSGQIDLGNQQKEKATTRLKDALSAASEAREKYIGQVLAMRTLADGVTEKWTKLAADDDLVKAVESANEATGKKLKLSPSPSFIGAEKRLEALEHTVLSESIPLEDDGAGLSVAVTLNGKHHVDMAVDSGATSVLLPFAMAKDFGLEPKSSDPKITCVLADGREVDGQLIKIDSVRVGKFTVENVECVVLDPKATKAMSLLGLSFLGNFTFAIDRQKSELRMVKVDSGDAPAKGKGAAKPKGAKAKQGKAKRSEETDS
ncbi:MAG TPA: TIGR02281 family clan AA aspartic protease [Pirellulales bacterium]|nr:TIGR02281 family clan AA aspartic protease [Pirellulales bacterium]